MPGQRVAFPVTSSYMIVSCAHVFDLLCSLRLSMCPAFSVDSNSTFNVA